MKSKKTEKSFAKEYIFRAFHNVGLWFSKAWDAMSCLSDFWEINQDIC